MVEENKIVGNGDSTYSKWFNGTILRLDQDLKIEKS